MGGSRVLIVDDERDLLTVLEFHLRGAGFTVITAASGGEALRWAVEGHPDLILLDVMLPDLSGTEVCRLLKQDPRTRHIPIIFLTARSSEMDRVKAFELGGDDYVVKPFSNRELILRCKAVLRRGVEPAEPVDENWLGLGVLEVDIPRHRVRVSGQDIPLTALEFRLLTTLMQRRGRVQTREVLLEDVWGISAEVSTRTVDTHVKRLREKLGAADAYVETVRGVGYRFIESLEELAGS